MYCVICVSIEKLTILTCHSYISKKKKKCKNEDVKIVKGDESVEILKILGLIENI